MSRLTSAAMFELIIFDMDGVLVDSEDAMAQMTVRALEEWGIHSSPDDFTRFRGMGDRAYVGGVSEMYGVPYEERMKEEAYRLFCENAGELVHVMPWTVPLLCELERRRFQRLRKHCSGFALLEQRIVVEQIHYRRGESSGVLVERAFEGLLNRSVVQQAVEHLCRSSLCRGFLRLCLSRGGDNAVCVGRSGHDSFLSDILNIIALVSLRYSE